MKRVSTSPVRPTASRAVAPLAVLTLLAPFALCQENPGAQSTTKKPDDAIAKSVARLDELVAKAESLLKGGDRAGAREACKEALAAAVLDQATPEWLAAADGVLWRLGGAAYNSGDLGTAHDAWQAVQRHREAALPDDHPDLQRARNNLALTKNALGDLPGALTLQEKVFAVWSAALPDDHPDLQRARNNLALTKNALGDLPGALTLQEKVFAVWSAALPDDHPDLQRARNNLALTKNALGDLPGALALQEKVFAVWSVALPDDHPELQAARLNLASTKKALGDLPGALTLQEKVFAVWSAALPDDHPDLQRARLNLANTRRALGDLPGALALQEKVFAVRSAALPDDHLDLQAARNSLANTKRVLGDLPGALTLQEKVLAVCSVALPDDHPDLQAARLNLAATKKELGDLPGALTLQEKVFAVRSAALPDDHPDLQAARNNLALTKHALGDVPGALALQEKVFAVWSAALPDDHPDLQIARNNLALTKHALGDLPGALALQEKVFAVRSKALPDDHPDLQAARGNLANTKRVLGDLPGALALFERVLAVRSKALPDDHSDLQAARNNLAITKEALGDLPGALALFERVLAVRSKALPDDHPDLQTARGNLAATKEALGDLPGALALQEKVLAVWSKALPDDHLDLQMARNNLALTKRALGDLPGALALQEKVLAVRSKALPDDHPDLQTARNNLALTKQALGDFAPAAQLHRSAVAGAVRRLSSQVVSLRDIVELAGAATQPVSDVASLLDLGTKVSAETAAELGADGLRLLEATRSAPLHLSRLQISIRTQHPDAPTRLLPQLAAATRRIEDAVALPAEGRRTPDGKQIARDDVIREATLAKDALEREWLALIPADARTAPDAATLANGLAQDEVAISFCTYTRWTNDPEKPWVYTSQERYGAFLLTPSGEVTWHSLAPTDEIRNRIAEVRTLALGEARGERVAAGPSLREVLTALRQRLLDPLLPALPPGTKRLVLSLNEDLSLLPLDTLPLDKPIDLQIVWSLRELLSKRTDAVAPPTSLVLGSVEYDARPEVAAPSLPEATTPIVAAPTTNDASRASNPADSDGDAKPKLFADLFNTEAERISKMFAKAHPEAPANVLRGKAASEAAFVAQAPGKTFLHLATHGYFAPESAWAATDAPKSNALYRFDVGSNDRVAQLSPYSLTGIALAGANLPADDLGRREGILTAQEIALLDLSACYLATLSACDTSLGVRRAGTGLASLRQSFHAAGARFVLATLWKVNDTEAETLMGDFYTRLWKQGQDPHTALREAKTAARQRGAAFRDWAGWVLTGR